MGLYRTVSTAFWTDSKVVDDFTSEDRYFYLYLFTNPHTNLCGCYEISVRQISNEIGYSKNAVENLIDRFARIHKVIAYDPESKELLLINWSKYNWTGSDKFQKALIKEILSVKNEEFKQYLEAVRNKADTVSIPYQYRMDTSNTYTNTNANADSGAKHKYGEYQNVLLTDVDLEKLKKEFPDDWEERINALSGYIKSKGAKYKDHLATIRNWARREKKETRKEDAKDRFDWIDRWAKGGDMTT